jgi:hypothetical protein
VTWSKLASLVVATPVSANQLDPPVPVARGKRQGPPTRSEATGCPRGALEAATVSRRAERDHL